MSKVFQCFLVKLGKADSDQLSPAAQGGGDRCKLFEMLFDGCDIAHQYRVIAPKNALRSQKIAEFHKRRDRLVKIGARLFNNLWITGDRVLEIIPVSQGIEFMQVPDQFLRVTRPENHGIHILDGKGDALKPAGVEWIADERKTGSDSVHEPVGIKGRDVGTAAGTDNHELLFIEKPLSAQVS